MRGLTCDLHQRINISATILKSSLESLSGSFSHLDLEWKRLNYTSEDYFKNSSSCLCSVSQPVVVHIADKHGVKGIQVPAEHSKFVQDEQLSLLSVSFTVSLQQLLLRHNLHRLLLQLLECRQKVAAEEVCTGLADDGLYIH